MSDQGVQTGHYVELLESKLVQLIQLLLDQVEIDEDWYLAENSDVATAVRQGALSSAREHYIKSGYFENRMPRPIIVDEVWYLKEYSDVAEAMKYGAFINAQQHFNVNGFKEGRLPSAGWSLVSNTSKLKYAA
jgi:hypothetical protein